MNTVSHCETRVKFTHWLWWCAVKAGYCKLKFIQPTYYIWYYGTADIRRHTPFIRPVTSSQPLIFKDWSSKIKGVVSSIVYLKYIWHDHLQTPTIFYLKLWTFAPLFFHLDMEFLGLFGVFVTNSYNFLSQIMDFWSTFPLFGYGIFRNLWCVLWTFKWVGGLWMCCFYSWIDKP